MEPKLGERVYSTLEELVTEKLDFVGGQMKKNGFLNYESCEMMFILLKMAELRIVIEELSEELIKTKKFINEHVKLR